MESRLLTFFSGSHVRPLSSLQHRIQSIPVRSVVMAQHDGASKFAEVSHVSDDSGWDLLRPPTHPDAYS